MIDIKLIRANPDRYFQAAKDKKFDLDIYAMLEIDAKLTAARKDIQAAKTAQNEAGKKIAVVQGSEKASIIAEMQVLKEQAKSLGAIIDELDPQFRDMMLLVPQPASADAPLGMDDTENVEIRKEGEIPQFDFELRDHVALGELLDIIDIPRGVKLAGSRNYILKGPGAMLHQAVLRFAMDHMISKGYVPLSVPVLVNDSVMYGTGYFPLGQDEAYLCERDNMSLVGTAEVPVTAYHSEEILDQAELPKKYVAMSTCFRREAGAAGKDTRGLYRIHLFDKVEQVVLCENDENASLEYHQEILRNSEEVMQALNLPYRVVNVCTGDLGMGQVQKFDIETWMPSRGSYGETHSASRFHEFQARRLNLRYRAGDGEIRFCHTLNNTVLASPRALIPLLELNQNADGSVNIPPVLRQYMGGMEIIEPK